MGDDIEAGFAIKLLEPHEEAMPSADELRRSVCEHAAQTFRAERRLEQYFLLVITKPVNALMVAHPVSNDPLFADYSHTEWIHHGVRELAEQHGARALFIASEVWRTSSRDYSAALMSQPRLDPNRREAVMVVMENPLARPAMQMWLAEIERNKGRPHLRDWTHDPNYSVREGRLAYLLPREAYGKTGSA